MTRALVCLDLSISQNITHDPPYKVPSQPDPSTLDEEQIARNVQALKNRLKPKGPGGAGGRKGRRGVGGAGSGLESVPGSEYELSHYICGRVDRLKSLQFRYSFKGQEVRQGQSEAYLGTRSTLGVGYGFARFQLYSSGLAFDETDIDGFVRSS